MNAPSAPQQQTRRILESVGWHANRAVSTTRWESELAADRFPPMHSVALQFLCEFGGLTIPDGGAGVTRAREPITLLPTECSGEADRFIEWSMHIGRGIAPIGELASGTCACAFLGIDEHAEIYVVDDALATFGQMPQALDQLVLGYMPRKIT